MAKRPIPFFQIFMLIIIIIIGYWFYKNTEIEEYEKTIGQSKEASKNSLLAANRLLMQHGFEFSIAENRNVFRKLNNNDTGLLWIHNINVLQTTEERQALHNWIENGGMLLASIDDIALDDEDTPALEFLSELGLQVNSYENEEYDTEDENESEEEYGTQEEYESDEENGTEDENETEEEYDSEEESYDDDSEYSDDEYGEDEFDDFFNLGRRPRNAGVNPIFLPEPDGTGQAITVNSEFYPLSLNSAASLNESNIFLNDESIIQLSVGDGFVGLYGDYLQFDNEQIGELDTAHLLMWLTQPVSNKNAIVAFHLDDTPKLLKTIWAKLSLAVLSFLVVLLGFLYKASARLGPIETEQVSNKSNLLAHLKARGTFWHKHNENQELTRAVKDAALHKLARRLGTNLHALTAKAQPSPTDNTDIALANVLTEAEQTQFVKLAAQVAQCSEAQAHSALFGIPKNNKQLLLHSNVLQRILQAKSHTIKLNNINASST